MSLICGLHAPLLYGQTRTTQFAVITVVDSISRQPIPNARIQDLVTGRSTTTSAEGRVELAIPQFVNAHGALLYVTRTGYLPSPRIFVDPSRDTSRSIALKSVLPSQSSGAASDHSTRRVAIHVTVTDDTNTPLEQSGITIERFDGQLLGTGNSAADGRTVLSVGGVEAPIRLSARKVGFVPYTGEYVADSAGQISRV